MSKKVNLWIARLEKFVDRPWYTLMIALLAALDLFILVIPTDGILISTVMLKPKKWKSSSFWIATGSALGTLAIALLIDEYGAAFLRDLMGDFVNGPSGSKTEAFIEAYGALGVTMFAVGVLPIHPAVFIGAALGMSPWTIFFSTWVGRLIKYFGFGYVATHAPNILKKLWGVGKEIEEIQIAEKAVKNKESSDN